MFREYLKHLELFTLSAAWRECLYEMTGLIWN